MKKKAIENVFKLKRSDMEGGRGRKRCNGSVVGAQEIQSDLCLVLSRRRRRRCTYAPSAGERAPFGANDYAPNDKNV